MLQRGSTQRPHAQVWLLQWAGLRGGFTSISQVCPSHWVQEDGCTHCSWAFPVPQVRLWLTSFPWGQAPLSFTSYFSKLYTLWYLKSLYFQMIIAIIKPNSYYFPFMIRKWISCLKLFVYLPLPPFNLLSPKFTECFASVLTTVLLNKLIFLPFECQL